MSFISVRLGLSFFLKQQTAIKRQEKKTKEPRQANCHEGQDGQVQSVNHKLQFFIHTTPGATF